MVRKLILGSVVVYVILAVLDAVVNMVLLEPLYRQTAHLWRPAEEMKIGLVFVTYAFMAFFFTLIFSRGYEGKGVGEGLRFGFYMGMGFVLPFAYSSYAAMPIPYSMALQWFLYGLIEFMIAGAGVSLVFGKNPVVRLVEGNTQL